MIRLWKILVLTLSFSLFVGCCAGSPTNAEVESPQELQSTLREIEKLSDYILISYQNRQKLSVECFQLVKEGRGDGIPMKLEMIKASSDSQLLALKRIIKLQESIARQHGPDQLQLVSQKLDAKLWVPLFR